MNDPDIAGEPMGVRLAHAMRFKVQDETKNMTAEEKTIYYREGSRAALERLGITPKYADLEI
ncbi:MAG: hypothetical protein FWG66_01650 [Spirochaetes bacterium]|nr:hypothetical protein [Spirochaetota bacterium]